MKKFIIILSILAAILSSCTKHTTPKLTLTPNSIETHISGDLVEISFGLFLCEDGEIINSYNAEVVISDTLILTPIGGAYRFTTSAYLTEFFGYSYTDCNLTFTLINPNPLTLLELTWYNGTLEQFFNVHTTSQKYIISGEGFVEVSNDNFRYQKELESTYNTNTPTTTIDLWKQMDKSYVGKDFIAKIPDEYILVHYDDSNGIRYAK